MEKQATRKPFVVPRLKEQATLAGVTLISGGTGGPTGGLSSRRTGKGSNLAARQGSNNRNA
jgi:hypothetical protein